MWKKNPQDFWYFLTKELLKTAFLLEVAAISPDTRFLKTFQCMIWYDQKKKKRRKKGYVLSCLAHFVLDSLLFQSVRQWLHLLNCMSWFSVAALAHWSILIWIDTETHYLGESWSSFFSDGLSKSKTERKTTASVSQSILWEVGRASGGKLCVSEGDLWVQSVHCSRTGALLNSLFNYVS